MKRNSKLRKVLYSSAFRINEKLENVKKIDATQLKLFGLLHCSGDPKAKANALFTILNKGNRAYFDKKLAIVFERLCALASWEIFGIAERVLFIEAYYSEQEIERLKE